MAQSLSQILLHVVFSTKYRKALIPDKFESGLHAYIAEICRACNSNAYRVGGIDNHIHIACSLPRTITVSKLLEEIKRSSSKWMKTISPEYANFAWQNGYGVFSLGQSRLPYLVRYIDNQKEHHRRKSFQQELLQTLKKNNITYDERYLWD